MGTLGNIIWIIFGGLATAIGWFLAGILWSITIVGIPVGRQCFKFASLSLEPFGKYLQYEGGGGSLLLSIIWLIVTGISMAVNYCTLGLLYSITIIGIPFGKQCFKLAKLSLMPFGAQIY